MTFRSGRGLGRLGGDHIVHVAERPVALDMRQGAGPKRFAVREQRSGQRLVRQPFSPARGTSIWLLTK